eukprot:gene10251-biopygen8066
MLWLSQLDWLNWSKQRDWPETETGTSSRNERPDRLAQEQDGFLQQDRAPVPPAGGATSTDEGSARIGSPPLPPTAAPKGGRGSAAVALAVVAYPSSRNGWGSGDPVSWGNRTGTPSKGTT